MQGYAVICRRRGFEMFFRRRKKTAKSRISLQKLEEQDMIKILFVCHGNICRSPMAEFILRDMLERTGREGEIAVSSAAVSREELGNPVYPPARRILAAHGIRCEGHAARQMSAQDYEKYDLLIGMDSSNITRMRRICGGDPDGKMSRLLDHTCRPGDVADPWYTGEFETTWRDIEEGCRALLDELR